MKYIRKDNRTNKLLFLLVMAIGTGLTFWGFFKLYWAWNLLTFPFGFLIAISGYKNYKKTYYEIQELEFSGDQLRIKFLNDVEKEIKYKDLSYALLVKKFYQPIRSVEFIEQRKIGFFRGNSIGKIEFAKWEKDIEKITRHLINNKFERKKWKFGWSAGDFLMIFAILFGMTEGVAENYIEGLEMNLSRPIGDLGEFISSQRDKSIDESIKSEDKYFRSTQN